MPSLWRKLRTANGRGLPPIFEIYAQAQNNSMGTYRYHASVIWHAMPIYACLYSHVRLMLKLTEICKHSLIFIIRKCGVVIFFSHVCLCVSVCAVRCIDAGCMGNEPGFIPSFTALHIKPPTLLHCVFGRQCSRV